MISSLLTFLIVGVVALVVLSVIMSVVGIAVGLASFLLFKVAPIVLIGYLALKLFGPKPRRISEADRKWLAK